MAAIKQIKCGMVNCFIIVGERGSVLVDTAVVRYRDMLVQTAKRENVKLIFHTHGHVDHIGNTAALMEQLSIPCAMHAADAEMVKNPKEWVFHSNTFLGKMIVAGTASNRIYHPPQFSVGRFFEGGETLEEFGMDARVIALPGHTRGSLGILVDGKGLIVGDAMFNVLKPTPARLYEELATMMESVGEIKNSGCETIYPGHGKPFSAKKYFRSAIPG